MAVPVPLYARRLVIRFEPSGRIAVVSEGATLLAAAQQAGIRLPAACQGQGDCCQCGVEIMHGSFSPLTDLEETSIAEGNLAASQRLACCARILSEAQVRIPAGSMFID